MSTYAKKLLPRLIQGKWRIQATVPVLGLVRKQFADQETAMAEYNRIRQQVDNHVAQAEIRETLLDKDQEKEAVSAYHLMKENWEILGDLSLVDCVRFCVQKYDRRVKVVTVLEALEHYVMDLASKDRASSHIDKCETKINRLANYFPAKLVEDFKPEDIISYISDDSKAYGPFAGRNVSKTTRHNELVYLRAFFNWCVAHKYAKASPCDASVSSPGRQKGEIQALTLDEVKAMLEGARYVAYESGVNDVLAYIALSIYCGLRPEELRPEDDNSPALTWDKFIWRNNGKTSTITIDYGVGKVSTRRVIEVPKICQEIVQPIAKESGLVVNVGYSALRSMVDVCKARAGFKSSPKRVKQYDLELSHHCGELTKKWIPDGLRHTAISYKLLQSGNDYDAVAEWSGNSPKIIKEHYKALISGTSEETPEDVMKKFYGET